MKLYVIDRPKLSDVLDAIQKDVLVRDVKGEYPTSRLYPGDRWCMEITFTKLPKKSKKR